VGEDDEIFYDKKPQRYAKDNRTAHLTVRSDKSAAYVTNNKRLYSTFCTVEAITTDRHEASRALFATAELLVCRAMLCIRAAIAGIRCPSVCLSVTFVSCDKTNKDIFEIFLLSGSQAILVFPCQTGWRYSDGNPSNGGVECTWGRQKMRF